MSDPFSQLPVFSLYNNNSSPSTGLLQVGGREAEHFATINGANAALVFKVEEGEALNKVAAGTASESTIKELIAATDDTFPNGIPLKLFNPSERSVIQALQAIGKSPEEAAQITKEMKDKNDLDGMRQIVLGHINKIIDEKYPNLSSKDRESLTTALLANTLSRGGLVRDAGIAKLRIMLEQERIKDFNDQLAYNNKSIRLANSLAITTGGSAEA